MIAEASAAARQVAVVIAPQSMPVGWSNITPDSTAGCTKMMYDMVRKVVSHAAVSVRTVVPF